MSSSRPEIGDCPYFVVPLVEIWLARVSTPLQGAEYNTAGGMGKRSADDVQVTRGLRVSSSFTWSRDRLPVCQPREKDRSTTRARTARQRCQNASVFHGATSESPERAGEWRIEPSPERKRRVPPRARVRTPRLRLGLGSSPPHLAGENQHRDSCGAGVGATVGAQVETGAPGARDKLGWHGQAHCR